MESSCNRRFFRKLAILALAGVLCGAGMARADVSPVWTNYEGVDGTYAVVATKGSNTFVAYGDEGGNTGALAMFDASGALKGVIASWDLSGGKVTAIAVSGSKVYVAGYIGLAGSGNEQVAVWSFKASSKGLAPLWESFSPSAVPQAGNYPIGIKALGSKIVIFFHTEDGGHPKGTIMGLNPKDGTKTWDTTFYDPGIVSWGQVNAIALKGSQVAAAGMVPGQAGGNWFSVAIYSTTDGSFLQSMGKLFDASPGARNEALAVAWVGSYVAAAGQITDAGTKKGYLWCLKVSGTGMSEAGSLPVYGGVGETKLIGVGILGTNAYYTGYGPVTGGEQWGFVGAYGMAPESKKRPHGDLWSYSIQTPDMTTTGLVVGKKGVYVSGYQESGGANYWFLKSLTLAGDNGALEEYIDYNGGNDSRALGLALGAKAVVGVGRCYDGTYYKCGVRAFAP
jgi:hypothetical protein